jgi:flagellar basal-body rod protein FlgB
MKINSISDQSIALLHKVLDLRADKEKVIASNIANSETPGYAPSRFQFEEELQQAVNKGSFSLKTTHASHIPVAPRDLEGVSGRIVKDRDATGIGDQNGVSLDQEMLALAENELLYETAAQLLGKKLTLRKYIIQGGQ